MANATTTAGYVRVANRQNQPARRTRDPDHDQFIVLLDTLLSTENKAGEAVKTVGITSSSRREGVTTVACNLALHAACQELHTLLVDGNANQPGLHRSFQLPASPGLADLNGDASIQRKAIHDLSSLPFKSLPASLKHSFRRMGMPRSSRNGESFTAPGLKIMTAGKSQPNKIPLPAALDAKQNCDRFLDNARDSYDLIIVDLPAVDEMNSCQFSLAHLDGLIFVLEAEATSDLAAHTSLQQLKLLDANVLGIVFNKYRNRLPRWIERKLGD